MRAHGADGLDHHVQARAVVHALGGHQIAETRELALARDDVTGAHELAHGLCRQPDVDAVVLERRWLLALLVAEQVDRGRPHHPEQLPTAVHDHPLRGQGLRVEPAQGNDPQEPRVLLDVLHHERDLIHVGAEHQPRPRPADAGDKVAQRVRPAFVGEGAQFTRDDVAHALLVPGCARRPAQLGKQFEIHV